MRVWEILIVSRKFHVEKARVIVVPLLFRVVIFFFQFGDKMPATPPSRIPKRFQRWREPQKNQGHESSGGTSLGLLLLLPGHRIGLDRFIWPPSGLMTSLESLLGFHQVRPWDWMAKSRSQGWAMGSNGWVSTPEWIRGIGRPSFKPRSRCWPQWQRAQSSWRSSLIWTSFCFEAQFDWFVVEVLSRHSESSTFAHLQIGDCQEGLDSLDQRGIQPQRELFHLVWAAHQKAWTFL